MSNTIKERFAKIKEMNSGAYDTLMHDKIEFNSFYRLSKAVRQLLRRYKVNGARTVSQTLGIKEIIAEINAASEKKKLLYVTITPSFNLLRQNIYVRKKGNYETVLLMESPWLTALMEEHFDTVYVYKSYYELANILLKAKPDIIHVQGSMLGSDFLCILAKLLSDTKVVFEFYDVPSLTINKKDCFSVWGEKNTELGFFAEQYACENADGIILGYSDEAEAILRKRYSIKSPVLEFHTYVCDEFVSNNELRYSHEDGKIHLVYGGYVYSVSHPNQVFGTNQFHKLIDEITKQGIYFDIYTSPHISAIKFEKFFPDYLAIAGENKRFRFMQGFNPNEAVTEFSRYDFGLLFYIFDQNSSLNRSNRMRVQGKFFFYLEAGLPIILSEEYEYVAKFVRQYEVGIVISQNDIYNLSEIISSYDYDTLRNNVKIAQKELSMDTQISKLLTFYDNIRKN